MEPGHRRKCGWMVASRAAPFPAPFRSRPQVSKPENNATVRSSHDQLTDVVLRVYPPAVTWNVSLGPRYV